MGLPVKAGYPRSPWLVYDWGLPLIQDPGDPLARSPYRDQGGSLVDNSAGILQTMSQLMCDD